MNKFSPYFKLNSLLCLLTFMIAAFGSSLVLTSQAEARVIVKERIKYYTVSGKNGVALAKSILKRGPKLTKAEHAIATTSIKLDVKNIKPGIRGRKCVIKSVNVHLNLTYKYPRWKNKKGASRNVQKVWAKFLKQVEKHEKTHGKIAKAFARDVDKQFKRLSGRLSRGCKDFGRGAKRKFDSLARAHQRKQANFDRRESRLLSRTTRLQTALVKAR